VLAITLLITASAALGVLVAVVASRSTTVAAWSARQDVVIPTAVQVREPRASAGIQRAANRVADGAPHAPPAAPIGVALR
jgi:hypothetical protein